MRPVEVVLTAGHSGDNPQLVPLIDRYRRNRGHPAQPGCRAGDIHVLADKAYSHPSTRVALRRRRISHTIPERRDQQEHRHRKGSRGGRPPNFDADLYAQRNTVERGFGRLKQWRGIATRYDKYALVYLGGVLLAAILQFRH